MVIFSFLKFAGDVVCECVLWFFDVGEYLVVVGADLLFLLFVDLEDVEDVIVVVEFVGSCF